MQLKMQEMAQLYWWLALLTATLTGGGVGAAGGGKKHYHDHQRHSDRSGFGNNESGYLRRGSPEDYGLRGTPVEEIVPPILESPNKKYDPRNQDINITSLRHILGKNFDPDFMSIHRPLQLRNNSLQHQSPFDFDYPFRKNRRGKLVARNPDSLPVFLQELKFRYMWLPDGTRARTSVSGARLERKLQNYLWAHTSCPVVFRWKDIGKRYWPRWIKEGFCPPGKQSCSIPPGMTCQPGAEYKTLLRWHCLNWELSKRCHWIKVPYPFVTKCSCSCPSASASGG